MRQLIKKNPTLLHRWFGKKGRREVAGFFGAGAPGNLAMWENEPIF